MNKEIRLGVSYSGGILISLANLLGANIKWSHSFLQRGDMYIEAHPLWGVRECLWHSEVFPKYALYALKDSCFEHGAHRNRIYEKMWAFAQGEVGKRYKWEALPIIAKKILQRLPLPWLGKRAIIGSGEVCTSLVDRTFLYIGVDLVPHEDSPFVLPDDLISSDLLKKVNGG